MKKIVVAFQSRWLPFVTALLFHVAAGESITPWTILTFQYPEGAAEGETQATEVAGLAAHFSRLPVDVTRSPVWTPPDDEFGCNAFLGGQSKGAVAIVLRGVCTFEDKALRALEAGARGLIVVSNSSEYWQMPLINSNDSRTLDLFAVMVANSAGDPLLRWSNTHKEAPVLVSMRPFESPFIDGAEVLMVFLATSVVALGAYVSTSDIRKDSSLAQIHRDAEVVEVQSRDAVVFCMFGSGMLMFLFYFMKYMIYVIIFCFCVGGGSSILEFSSLAIRICLPSTRRRACSIEAIGTVWQVSDLLALGPVLLVVFLFLNFRNTGLGWIFQDIMGIGFLCTLQKTLRLPNIQVASLLLSFMFFFDIFWVFLSPLLFRGKSVMEEVATAGHTGESVPMLLRLPELHRSPLSHERMLGFGDIALPGLLVSYCLRYDIVNKRTGCSGYFLPCLGGYACGLGATMVALLTMQMSQPALLYLVPGTLGTTVCLGTWRRELRSLWTGESIREADASARADKDAAQQKTNGDGRHDTGHVAPEESTSLVGNASAASTES